MSAREALATQLERMRRDFDHGFTATPQVSASSDLHDLLAIRVGADAYALRLSEVSGLYADKVVRRLPGPWPELIGVAGFRGTVAPVYDLAQLLGYPGGAAARWVALVMDGSPFALAFHEVEQHLRVPSDALRESRGRAHVHGVVTREDIARPIVSVPSIRAALVERAQQLAKER